MKRAVLVESQTDNRFVVCCGQVPLMTLNGKALVLTDDPLAGQDVRDVTSDQFAKLIRALPCCVH